MIKVKKNISMSILIIMLIIVGYFITVIDSKADDELVPVVAYFDEISNTVYFSNTHSITISLDENETIDEYIITYYKGEHKFIRFTDKFIDLVINSDNVLLHKYYTLIHTDTLMN